MPPRLKPLLEERWRAKRDGEVLSVGLLPAAGMASAHRQSFSGLRRGTFHRRKVPKTRRGLRPPVPLRAPAACIPGSGIARAAALHRAVPSHTASPFPASRGPVESASRCGYRTFLKGRTNCPRTRGGHCTRQLLRTDIAVAVCQCVRRGAPTGKKTPADRGGLPEFAGYLPTVSRFCSRSSSWSRSAIRAINSELVGFPLELETV